MEITKLIRKYFKFSDNAISYVEMSLTDSL